MKRKIFLAFLLILFFFLNAAPGLSGCTSFAIADKKGNFVLGENFDFPTGLGHIQVNLKGIQKRAFISVPEKALEWTSKYGSITFNQNGREFPYSGMNEAGLVVVKLMLNETVYPGPDDRFGLEELQWIQYQLDVSASVEDVAGSDRMVRASYLSAAPLHFFVADARGNAAALEYLDGRLVVHAGKGLPHRVLANNTYQDSLTFLEKMDAEARDKLLNSEGMTDSLQRFAKAALLLHACSLDAGEMAASAFAILEKVAQMGGTQWSIVYDLKNGIIRLKTAKNRNVRELALRAFDFSKKAKRLCIDIDQDFKGVPDFKEYSPENNFQLVDAVWNIMEGFLKDLPFKKEWAQYPDDPDSKTVRKFKLSAAKAMAKAIRTLDLPTALAEIERFKREKENYYLGESELIFHAVNLAQADASKLPGAIAMLKTAVESFPGSANALYWLAKGYSYSGDGAQALACLKKALAMEPENRLTQWDLEGVLASQNPPVLDLKTLESYAGEFGERKISLEKDRLAYEKSGQRKLFLLPMKQDIFQCVGVDYLRIRFIRENERVIALECLYNDGHSLRSERTK